MKTWHWVALAIVIAGAWLWWKNQRNAPLPAVATGLKVAS